VLVGLLGSDEVAEPLVKYMRKMNATTADASEVIVDIQERLKAKAAAVAVAPSKKQARVRKPSKKAAAAKKVRGARSAAARRPRTADMTPLTWRVVVPCPSGCLGVGRGVVGRR
jgi:hypothetical protein